MLFPELTDAQFDDLDTDGDGFLSRAELDLDTPGGCAGPDSFEDYFIFGLLLYIVALFDWLMRMPGRFMAQLFGSAEGGGEPVE